MRDIAVPGKCRDGGRKPGGQPVLYDYGDIPMEEIRECFLADPGDYLKVSI